MYSDHLGRLLTWYCRGTGLLGQPCKQTEDRKGKTMANRRCAMMACMLVVFAMTYTPAAGEDIGQIKTLAGKVYIVRQSVKRPAQVGDRLEAADAIITGPDGSVGITFIDNSRFSAGPRSHIELEQFQFDPTTYDGAFSTKMQHGTLAIISGHIAKRSPDAMKVRTPTTILGVRGTRVLLKVEG